jgi:hypothetical protein
MGSCVHPIPERLIYEIANRHESAGKFLTVCELCGASITVRFRHDRDVSDHPER